MTKDLNGAWLALGVASAVAAAGVTMANSGSRALSGVDDLRRMAGKKPWSEMTQEEREREERGFQRFKQESRDEISRGHKRMEREPDWHTAWHDTSGELGQPAGKAYTYDEDGFRVDPSREADRKRREARREADREADRDEHEAMALRSRRRGPLPEGSMATRAKNNIPHEAWIHTDEKSRRWATDGSVAVREDAPTLAASSKGVMKLAWVTPDSANWTPARFSFEDLLSHFRDFASKPLPRDTEIYFNKRYGPLLKRASGVRVTRAQLTELEGGRKMQGPITALDKNGDPWALVTPLPTHDIGKSVEVVNQHGEPRTAKV